MRFAWGWTSSTTTTPSPSPEPFAAATRFPRWRTFLTGVYNSSGFTQTFANTVVAQTNPNVGFYAQDEWKVSPRLTLNLGLRYDLQFLRTIATDTNNISPRGGFAWSPFASRKTVIRGSYGLFYDRIPCVRWPTPCFRRATPPTPATLSQISISLSPTQAGAPVFPNILGSLTLPPGVLFNFSTMDPHMKNAYSRAGQLRNRAPTRRAQHAQRGLSAPARPALDHLREPERALLRRRRAPTMAAGPI